MVTGRYVCYTYEQHQFKPTESALVCRFCGLVEPYPDPVTQKHRPNPKGTLPPRSKKSGQAFSRSWMWANHLGVTQCAYCRKQFSEERPPTRDHVIPKAEGGRFGDGFVISCQSCNGARGKAPHEEYMKAVEAEWEAAIREDRQYRRPKWRLIDGSEIITVGPWRKGKPTSLAETPGDVV